MTRHSGDTTETRTELNHASVFSRGAAYLIDCGIGFCIFAALQLTIFAPAREALGLDQAWFTSGWNTQIYTLLTISLPIWMYFAATEASIWRGTVGKHFLRLKVSTFPALGRIKFPVSVLRTVAKLLPWEFVHLANNLPEPIWYADDVGFRPGFAVAAVLMVAYVAMAAFGVNGRAPHDYLAGTVVVKVPGNDERSAA